MTKNERILSVVVVVLLGLLIWIGKDSFDKKSEPKIPDGFEAVNTAIPKTNSKNKPSDEQKSSSLIVDVKGAVKTSGVYEMKPGNRVNDAIIRAGGFSVGADTSRVNLAQILKDEMVIYVPRVGEKEPDIQKDEVEDGKVNVNNGTSVQLETIPGIGPSKAKAIIDYREENGPFSDVNELTNVPGIGAKTVEQLKEYITVSN
ncbi:helix-hairpin-helix domain-containing protein [Pseudalkalibacillus berkeleyi]|uniref:Helix-hairpin-helix domain-containing protein n=1 Tax=Pseudalkalibacillus berkeleyi TaxID=1069813 RepID=A0ABS9H2C4_9BACL|nr:helix-hairpin-helix domain-containing protein [Pseudalkalibacillus berkeleyi]MCF6137992.1 helix-hairpin-helix domain-containing protein [Pseudalkalibacillus berkeleyi]